MLLKFIEMVQVIGVGEKTGASVVAALNEVEGSTGKLESRTVGHGRTRLSK